MKRGFTLIELLAVIVILAIIALIAVPIVIHIISDVKKSSSEQTIDLYMDTVKKTIANENMKVKYNPDECEIQNNGNLICYKGKDTLKTSKGLDELEIKMKGQIPTDGIIYIKNSKIAYKRVVLGEMEYKMDINGKKTSKVYEPPILVKKDTNYIGYYADIDEDGKPEGIIFADLAFSRDGQWGVNNWGPGGYSYAAKNGFKKYSISKEKYNGDFGENYIISPLSYNKESRFYVMSLTDFTANNSSSFYWYYGAYGHMDTIITSKDFGKGKENTRKMIEKWKAAGTSEGYADSPQNDYDIWGYIEAKYQEGWFLPSVAELAAFSKELGITSNEIRTLYKLGIKYCSSTQKNNTEVYAALYYGSYYCTMDYNVKNNKFSVRLATTF